MQSDVAGSVVDVFGDHALHARLQWHSHVNVRLVLSEWERPSFEISL